MRAAFWGLVLCLSGSWAWAAGEPTFSVPPLTGPVVDQAGLLSSSTRDSLSAYLRQLVERGGAQIQVAIIPNLGGLSIEEASIKITDQWRLGKKKEDRGVLLLIAAAEHKVRIEVGQGLEGDLPDVTASRIIHEVISPRFREGSSDRGVIDGVLAIVHYTDPKLADDVGQDSPAPAHTLHKRGFGRIGTIIFWLIILLLFFRPGRRGGGMGGGMLAYGLLGGLGGGGGGGSGGGWSGGGGGFSGGGASGDW